MNTVQKTSGDFNPINRDLAIVFTTGFVVAITIVIMGIVIVNQL